MNNHTKLPSVSAIAQGIRTFRSMVPSLSRSDGVFGGKQGATCTVCLSLGEKDWFVGDVKADISAEHTRYGSVVVPRLGVKFDVFKAARQLLVAAKQG